MLSPAGSAPCPGITRASPSPVTVGLNPEVMCDTLGAVLSGQPASSGLTLHAQHGGVNGLHGPGTLAAVAPAAASE